MSLQSGPASVLTISKKKVKNIGIFLKDEDEEDDEEPERPAEETKPEMFGRGKRSAVIENKLRVSPRGRRGRGCPGSSSVGDVQQVIRAGRAAAGSGRRYMFSVECGWP